MKAVVVRNGSHQGQPFVEVKAGQSQYAVPVNAELPLGTEVNIEVTVVEVPKAPEVELEGSNVSAVAAPAAETVPVPETEEPAEAAE